MNSVEDALERHYWKAVTLLVILILAGTGFWGVRRFAPAVFLGEPDLIAVPNTEHPQDNTSKSACIQQTRAAQYQYCLSGRTPNPA